MTYCIGQARSKIKILRAAKKMVDLKDVDACEMELTAAYITIAANPIVTRNTAIICIYHS